MNESYNKTVLITGASRGIGAATARIFAKNKYNVIINCLNNIEKANQLAQELEREYSIKTLVLPFDISNEEDVKNNIELAYQEFNNIDVLVNNAGIAIDSTIEDKKVENIKRTLDVNLIGPFLMCKYIGKRMYDNKKGSIINVSSTNSIDSFYPYSIDYDASKAGVNILTHDFAIHFAPYVKVNTIAPGWVNTEMNKELDADYIKEECKHILLERFAEPEEIAEEIYHIANSSYLNDSIIKVDGGRC